MKRFYEFCVFVNLFNPFPLTEKSLCYFASYLATRDLSAQTIKVYVAAVRDLHINMGFPDPRDHSSLPLLKRVQAGIQRVQALKSKGKARVRLPITPHLLRLLHSHWFETGHPDKLVLWAVASLCFAGFFRLGELLSAAPTVTKGGLSWGDVSVDNRENSSIVRVHLHFSKCDQFGKGVDVYVGHSASILCPVVAMSAYLTIRDPRPGPFFLTHENIPLSKGTLVSEMRKALSMCGIEQGAYSGHSFRIGAATAAAQAGLSDSLIQTLGRWSSGAFLSYIQTPRVQLAAVTAAILPPRSVQGSREDIA